LTIYNYKNGPCYRCLYPKPPPPETVTSCSDGGVLGVVPGIIGCLQAFWTISLLLDDPKLNTPQLLIFNGMQLQSFRHIRLRERRKDCAICGDTPTIHQLIDYPAFCQSAMTDQPESISLLSSQHHITCKVSPHNMSDVPY
jgi:adenylyltransferase/sulfurtransferase